MTAKIRVVFDMVFDPEGESKADVSFKFVDYPAMFVPDSIKAPVIEEIRMICGAVNAASSELFPKDGDAISKPTFGQCSADAQPWNIDRVWAEYNKSEQQRVADHYAHQAELKAKVDEIAQLKEEIEKLTAASLKLAIMP